MLVKPPAANPTSDDTTPSNTAPKREPSVPSSPSPAPGSNLSLLSDTPPMITSSSAGE